MFLGFGFGVQRLKDENYKMSIEADTECTDVQEYRYTQAIIDNFAPLNQQFYWDGEGQRYWINEKLWGGIGYPIFVFIGGEWVESCKTLTDSVSHLSFLSFISILFFTLELFNSNICINLLPLIKVF